MGAFRMGSMRLLCGAVLAFMLAGSGAVHAQVCTGDCDGNGTVSINELILAVDIALEHAGVARCPAADRNGSGSVSIDELVTAVDAALDGCPVATPTPTVTPEPDVCAGVPSFPGVAATTVRITTGLDRPTTVTAPPGDFSRVFVVEQPGDIRIVKDGVLLPDPFLSIPDRVSCCVERGLLGLAFPPDFATTGWFFVDYTDPAGNTAIARYHVSADPDRADRDSERVLIGIEQPFANHNGGQLAFGPDGYLYIGMGDGGSGGDPLDNAKNDDVLLGKILRMDVRVPADSTALYTIPSDNPHAGRGDPLGLIWAKGLRNPWRFGFDRATGDLYIADVGQNRREEIDVQPASSRGGENYGWRIFEGFSCYNPAPAPSCPDPPTGYTMPVLDYPHTGGRCSITGGYVYRGCALPDLRGEYLFADYCTPFIESFHLVDGVVTGLHDRTTELAPGNGQRIDQVSTFGEDARGEIYIADYLDGELYKIVPAVPAP